MNNDLEAAYRSRLLTDTQIEKWKRAAKKLVKTTGITHTQALDQIARENGFQDGWWGVAKALKEQQ